MNFDPVHQAAQLAIKDVYVPKSLRKFLKTKNTMKTFYVWKYNKVDSRDDEPEKIKAESKFEAECKVSEKWRWSSVKAMTKKEFFKEHPDWRGLI